MELDFDKEINALLRQAARSGEFVSTNEQNHLDADEISAFAENALPEKTRKFYIKHFADCDRCRMILSNTILLNQEAETESASSAVAAPIAPEIVAAKISWYRKMFLMPNLAYTMGGLVLVFGGMLGFLVLQNANKSGVSDVSQIQQNEPARAGGPNADNDGAFYNSNSAASNANAMASNANTAITSASNSSSSVSNSASTNTSANVQSSPPARAADETSTADITAEQRDQNASKPASDNDFQVDGADKKAVVKKEEKPADRKDDAEISQNDELAKSATVDVAPPPAPKSMPAQPSINQSRAENLPLNGRRMESFPQTAPREKKRKDANLSAGNTRQIGGKTFNRIGGVWIDSAYNKTGGGPSRTQTIQRGSSQYRNLDKQVRIIAESLDGAVIIVWRDGAYRIQ